MFCVLCSSDLHYSWGASDDSIANWRTSANNNGCENLPILLVNYYHPWLVGMIGNLKSVKASTEFFVVPNTWDVPSTISCSNDGLVIYTCIRIVFLIFQGDRGLCICA